MLVAAMMDAPTVMGIASFARVERISLPLSGTSRPGFWRAIRPR